ncbi:MAG: hypothetical protein Q8Q09_20920 [Deltaproteobacteria bacterium]|nr:hypothetical protein [Deltaproteobacteria bacterium]
MSHHPTQQDLYARTTDALKHAKQCSDCALALSRLSCGRSLIESAQRADTAVVDWDSLDAAVLSHVESAVEHVRAERKRSAQRSRFVQSLGFSVAIAAAGLLVFRGRGGHVDQPQERAVATHHASQSAGGEAILPAIPVNAWAEARVLLVAGEVLTVRDGVPSEALSSATHLRAGARVRGTSAASRAVIATSAGQRIDSRGESQVELARLDPSDGRSTLERGEARVDVEANSGRLMLAAHQWNITAKHGAFVAKIEGESVRLRVLSGVVDCAHAQGQPERVAPGQELLLDKHGRRSIVAAASHNDDLALDTQALHGAIDGELLAVPALAEGTSLQLAGGILLPGNTRAMRVRAVQHLEASLGSERWTLTLDPRAHTMAPPAWQPERTAASNLPVNLQTQRAARTSPVPTSHATRETLTSTTVPPEAQAGLRAVQRMLGSRTRHCFERCERNATCGETSGIAAIVDLDAAGRVSSVRLEGAPSGDLSTCIEREVRATWLPTLANNRVNLGRFAR